jgi:hypothetical protein
MVGPGEGRVELEHRSFRRQHAATTSRRSRMVSLSDPSVVVDRGTRLAECVGSGYASLAGEKANWTVCMRLGDPMR